MNSIIFVKIYIFGTYVLGLSLDYGNRLDPFATAFGDYGEIKELLNECKSGFKTSTIKADYMIVTVFLERAENNFEFSKCVPLIKMNYDKLCSMVYFLFFRTKLLIMTVLLFSLKSTSQSKSSD